MIAAIRRTGLGLYEQSLRLFVAMSDQRGRAVVTHSLAIVTAVQGDSRGAPAPHRAILPLKQALGDREGIICSVVNLGHLAVADGRLVQTVLWCAAAEAERERIGAILPAHERSNYARAIEAARSGLGTPAFDAAWEHGRLTSWAALVAEALAPDPEPLADALANPFGDLTAGEIEVLRLVAVGRSNSEIAETLMLSLRTVERHLANMCTKVGTSARVARTIATAYALNHRAALGI